MIFLDLENAFGSISHKLILDMLAHGWLQQGITTYIADLYAILIAYVKKKEWSTDKFNIGIGVFQGGTLTSYFPHCLKPNYPTGHLVR